MSSSIGSRFDPVNNNFDIIRMIAATMVVFSHSYSLAGVPSDPLSEFLSYGYAGTIGVVIFFVISGFLVAKSAEEHAVGSYLLARMLRILPGLALVTIIETLIIAPAFYDGKISVYFENWALVHLKNILIWPQNPVIPDVFAKLRFPALNGSLWTIPIEAAFYLLLPIIALLGRVRRWVYLLLFVASLVLEKVCSMYGFSEAQPGPDLIRGVQIFHAVHFFSFFSAGICLWKYRDVIKFDVGWFALAFAIVFAARQSMMSPWVMNLCLPYLIIFIALASGTGSKLKRRWGDLSYGTYLFGYPIANMIVSLGNRSLSPATVFIICFPVTLLVASFSWRFVERPSLSLKKAVGVPRRAGNVARPDGSRDKGDDKISSIGDTIGSF